MPRRDQRVPDAHRSPRPDLAGSRSPRRPTLGAVVVAAVVAGLLLAGCGTSGRTLRDPTPGATAPPRRGATTSSSGSVAPVGLSVRSPAWVPGGAIPAEHTCDGADTSPPLELAGAPAGTAELVLVVSDPDAGGFVHWVVAGIPPETTSVPAGTVPPGAVQLVNGAGQAGWSGPCPPSGIHTYDVALFALAQPSGLTAESTAEQLQAAISGALSTAAMTGTYTRA